MPDLEAAFRDRMLDILGDRFKLEYIAERAQQGGATEAKDVLHFVSQIATHAQRQYPQHHFLDGIYKLLQSMPQE